MLVMLRGAGESKTPETRNASVRPQPSLPTCVRHLPPLVIV
jgi:hypothetical protein